MSDETEHPLEQAEEALRVAMRKLDDEAAGLVVIDAGTITSGKITYPECSNGPDCQCPFHFGLARVTVRCPVCGRTDVHGDRVHQYRYTDRHLTRRSDGTLEPGGHWVLTPGPDADGFEQWRREQGRAEVARQDAEAELRKRRRELAEQHEAEIRDVFGIPQPQHDGGWHEGKCTGCFMDDEPVKGPPGAELCRFCDERRILAPPVPPSPEPRLPYTARLLERAWSRREYTTLAIALAGAALMLTDSGLSFIGLIIWIAGMTFFLKA